MEKQLREMIVQDTDDVLEIIRAHHPFDGDCAEQYYHGYFSDSQRIESLDEVNYVVVDKNTDKPVGVSGYTPDKYKTPKIYWLSWTYVHQNYRRHGFGSALLQYVLEQVTARGARRLFIDTSSLPSYGPALKLYQSFGFKVEASLTDYHDEGENFVILGKYL